MRHLVNLTRGLAITSVVLTMLVVGYAVRGELIAVAIAVPVTVALWTLTAVQMRANVIERSGHWTDPSDVR